MATAPSIRVIKSFTFKGGVRQWSNRYHMSGGTPANDTEWHALMDAVVTAEEATYGNTTTIVECVGYAAGSDVPVSTKNYSTTGTCSFVGGDYQTPGEVCALLRWSTSARSTKNHPIYLFNYYHGPVVHASSGASDLLDTNQRSAIGTYANSWISGFSDGSHTLVRCGPNSELATGQQVEEYVTHRDFPATTSL